MAFNINMATKCCVSLITVNDTSYEALMSEEKNKNTKHLIKLFSQLPVLKRMLKEHIKYYHNDENGKPRM